MRIEVAERVVVFIEELGKASLRWERIIRVSAPFLLEKFGAQVVTSEKDKKKKISVT